MLRVPLQELLKMLKDQDNPKNQCDRPPFLTVMSLKPPQHPQTLARATPKLHHGDTLVGGDG